MEETINSIMFIIAVLNYSWKKRKEFLKLQNAKIQQDQQQQKHGLLFHFFCEMSNREVHTISSFVIS